MEEYLTARPLIPASAIRERGKGIRESEMKKKTKQEKRGLGGMTRTIRTTTARKTSRKEGKQGKYKEN